MPTTQQIVKMTDEQLQQEVINIALKSGASMGNIMAAAAKVAADAANSESPMWADYAESFKK